LKRELNSSKKKYSVKKRKNREKPKIKNSELEMVFLSDLKRREKEYRK
jgi:hypothetical protein